MSGIKITKEMVDKYLELHDILYSKAREIRKLLHEIDPQNYNQFFPQMEYYDPDLCTFRWCGWEGCMGSYELEYDGVPTEYLYDEEWIEKKKEEVRIRNKKQKQELLIKEQKKKEEIERKEREEYERLKKKFEQIE